jgi:hypothetical protein
MIPTRDALAVRRVFLHYPLFSSISSPLSLKKLLSRSHTTLYALCPVPFKCIDTRHARSVPCHFRARIDIDNDVLLARLWT